MNTIWKFMSGKKTTNAAFLNLTALWVSQKSWIDQNDLLFISGAITVWTGVAVGHKMMKGGKK